MRKYLTILFLLISIAVFPARYWIGDSGSWSDVAHWSDADGGSGGFSVPVYGDAVYFTANSFSADGASVNLGGSQVTMTSFDCSGIDQTATITNFYQFITYGNTTLSNKITFSSGTRLYLNSGTFTQNGASISCGINFEGSGVSGNVTTTGAIRFGSSAINLGSSVFTCGSVDCAVTVTCGTSTINCSGNFTGNGQTYNTVVLTGTTYTITGANTFATLTLTGASAYTTCSLAGNQTVTGTLTMNGNNKGANRLFVNSSVAGTQRTLTAATVSATNLDLKDIVGAGAGSWDLSAITGRSQNLGNCTNITFSTGTALFWYGNGASNWSDDTKWFDATAGGGTGGYIPLNVDTVTFDASSFSSASNTITVNRTAYCNDLDISGIDQTMTLSSSANYIYIYGSMTLPASNLTWTFTSTAFVYFKATSSGKTITMGSTSNRTFNAIYFDGINGEWTLQDNFTATTHLRIYNGSVITNNNTINIGAADIQVYTGIKALTLGSSSVTCYKFDMDASTGLTLNTGTSTIYLYILYGAGKTYYDVVFNNYYEAILTGANTFNNLTRTSGNIISAFFDINANQTVNGIFTVTGLNAYDKRVITRSNVLGTQRTITVNGSCSFSNCDFRDIVIAGSAAPVDYSSAEIGNCGGNSGITFRTGEKRYYHVGTGNYHDAKWYSATNGGGSAKGMPLPQDTAMFDASSFDGTATLTIANSRIGSLDMSGVDDAVTLTLGNAIEIYGSHIYSNNITPSGSYARSFLGRGSYNINTYGKSVYRTYFYCGSWTLQSNYVITVAFQSYFYMSGNGVLTPTVDLNDFDVTCATFTFTAYPNILYMGNGTITLKNGYTGPPWSCTSQSTIYCEGSTIKYDGNTNGVGFYGAGKTYNNLWIANVSSLYISDFRLTTTFNNIKIDAGGTLNNYEGSTLIISSLTAIGTAVSPIIIRGDGGWPNYIVTLSCASGKICCDYLTLSYITATGGASFYGGSHSTYGTSVTGWTQSSCPSGSPFFWAEF